MAKFPPLKSIKIEDFSDCPAAFRPTLQKLVNLMNPFITAVYDALAGTLTAPDNIAASYKTFTMRGGTGAEDNTFKFSHGLRTKPRGCFVIGARRTDGTTITSPIYVTWQIPRDVGQIEITAISMLLPGVDYEITVRVE